MKILITGASGFIGRNLLSKITGPGREIFILGRAAPINLPKAAKFIKVDLTDRRGLEKIASGFPNAFDVCINLAGQTDISVSMTDPVMDLEANAVSVINILSALRFKKFIHISTGSVYDGHSGMITAGAPLFPAIPYAISKYASELYVRSLAMVKGSPGEYLILRLFNPYGPHENPIKFIPRLVERFGIEKKRTIVIRGSGIAMIDPMYVDDCIDAILKAVDSKTANKVIDICRGNSMTIAELATRVASIFGIMPRITFSGAVAEEVRFYGNPDPQIKLLGFKPAVSLRDGIRKYAAFLKDRNLE